MNLNDLQDIYVDKEQNCGLQGSWFELVEEELKDSLEDKILSGSVTGSLSDSQSLISDNAEDIICLDYEEYSDLELLQYESCVMTYLRNKLNKKSTSQVDQKFKELDINDMVDKLEWLLEVTAYLSKKIGSDIEKGRQKYNKNTSKVFRSSYKFCDFNYKCEFNYCVKKSKGCYAQHFVHNVIYYDILSIIKYLKDCMEKSKDCADKSKDNVCKISDDDRNEIRKSINTISYVINHMYEELQESGSHVNRFLTKKNKKKRKKTKEKDRT